MAHFKKYEKKRFDARKDFREGKAFGGGPRKLELHDATCAKCGKPCQVPFRPSGSKPVLCRDCFKAGASEARDFPSRSEPAFRKERAVAKVGANQLDQINEKLDKILKALQIE